MPTRPSLSLGLREALVCVFLATFWPAYPKRKGRQTALDAFVWAYCQTAEAVTPAAFAAQLVVALGWQRREQPDPRWWPEPTRWLLERRFEDEPLEVVTVPTARERADYRQWKFSLGPEARLSLDEWVRRQRERVS